MNKKYKKFIFYVLIIDIFVFTVLGVVVFKTRMFFMNTDLPASLYYKKTTHSKTNYNFLVLGSSKMLVAFKPNLFDTNNIRSVNLSISGSSMITPYHTLKYFLKQNKPKYLLVYFPFEQIVEIMRYWSREVNFNLLNFMDYFEVSINARKLDDMQNLITNINWGGIDENTITYLEYINVLNPFYYKDSIKQALKQVFLNQKTRYQENMKIKNIIETNKGWRFFGQEPTVTQPHITKTNFAPTKLMNFYTEKIFQLANEHNIRVFFFFVPESELTCNWRKQYDFYPKYVQYYKNLSKKYNFTVLNEPYCLPNEKFGDASHLYGGVDETTLKMQELVFKELNISKTN